ncbi:NXPE family member 3-like isoform X2 [Sphaeramia orbicularis]|uniref:NXPE family member 3-like isoform X2 n=1 Tax=Sphaeramia orbicularis TaxID=375764 RepID=UPI00117E66F6|nr:NXPE family member 3-like isoform X2 [Sphaeramia orbicularis]
MDNQFPAVKTATPGGKSPPDLQSNFCSFQPYSEEESLEKAVEERHLLNSVTWPETPLIPVNFTLKQTSDPAHSTFTILPGGGEWRVGDHLKIIIQVKDFEGHPKTSGGDFIVARLHNPKLGAGVAGQVVDLLNGSYSAVFPLLWNGSAEVEVTLVHSSEAVTVLRRLNREQPDRIYFQSVFRSGSVSETTTCNICLRPNKQPICNYTDLHTGEPWFCFKPKKLSCDARISHFSGIFKENLRKNEKELFKSHVNMKVSIPALGSPSVLVLPKKEGYNEKNNSVVSPGPTGYYYQNVWRALGGTTVHQFNSSSAITECLKGKVIHLYGDSTIRQWFDHLRDALPDLKEFNLHSLKQPGPFMALDYPNNIMVTFRCHGPPIRILNVQTSQLHYIANELDNVVGGSNTVIVIGIWAHFGNFPIDIYIRRLQTIRRAVMHLLDRAPGTLVIIRTANLKDLTLLGSFSNSDWYSLQQDKVLRAVFKGINVHLVDAWEMTLAHHLPHNLHPQPPIIKNMINVVLSYICPKRGG